MDLILNDYSNLGAGDEEALDDGRDKKRDPKEK